MIKKILCLGFVLGLAACADSPLGFGKSPPNEFLILTYPPLTIPNTIALRAPSNPDAVARTSSSTQAQKLLYGRLAKAQRKLSSGEKALLKRMGADKAQPNIRALIARDQGLALYPKTITKKLIPSP